jgi:hypothetical protein
VEDLLDDSLRQLDALLDDEALVTTVWQRQAQRWPQSRWRGRPGTPADVALRLLGLQCLRGWSFDETEREVRASLVYRWITHLYLGRVPDAKTLIRLSQVIGDEGVRALHSRVVELVIRAAKVHPLSHRFDAVDGWHPVLRRAIQRLDAVPQILRDRVRNRLRAARRRVWQIVRASRRRGQAGQAQLKDSYRHLLAIWRHQDVFGRPPRLVAADAGFWSGKKRDAAEAAGVKQVCVPAAGRPSAAQRQIQHQRWFRRGLRWRTGCEGRISVLKRRDGLTRCRYHGFDGTQRWVGWGVIAHNLHLRLAASR